MRGPGDPALLTVRARELLADADVVAPDKLIPPELLETLPQGVEILQVGHRGRGSRTADHRIHPAILQAALAGKHVVRLKAGDPMVFGRGAEEAQELRAAGIPFEIVPGVSSALGAAAYTGIPLTHREDASDVTFVTGHESSSDRPSHTLWNRLGANRGTVVLFMAAQRLERSLAQLVEAGRPASTPAAYVAGATHSSQRVIVGTLNDLAHQARNEDRSRPAIVIVGDVVLRRKAAEWIEARRPLLGRNVFVARSRRGPSRIATRLRALGARVVEAPRVEDAPLECDVDLLTALGRELVANIVGDSITGQHLRTVAARLQPAQRRRLFELPTIALTERAGADLTELGFPVAAVAHGSCSEAVREAVEAALGKRCGPALIPAERRGRPHLSEELLELGLEPIEVEVFERSYRFPRGAVGNYDAAVYPSSSAVRAVFTDALCAPLLDVPSVSIGPHTTRELHASGVRFVEQAEEDTIDATLALLARVLVAPRFQEVTG